MEAFVDHLERIGNTINSYTLGGAFPTSVGGMPLDYETTDAIETFDVTFSYQYFESNTTT